MKYAQFIKRNNLKEEKLNEDWRDYIKKTLPQWNFYNSDWHILKVLMLMAQEELNKLNTHD